MGTFCRTLLNHVGGEGGKDTYVLGRRFSGRRLISTPFLSRHLQPAPCWRLSFHNCDQRTVATAAIRHVNGLPTRWHGRHIALKAWPSCSRPLALGQVPCSGHSQPRMMCISQQLYSRGEALLAVFRASSYDGALCESHRQLAPSMAFSIYGRSCRLPDYINHPTRPFSIISSSHHHVSRRASQLSSPFRLSAFGP